MLQPTASHHPALFRSGPLIAVLLVHAVAWLTASGLVQAADADEQVSLTEAGEPRAVIVLPAEPEPGETLAAEELVEHLALISGAALRTVEATDELPADRVPIYLGRAADESLDQATRAEGDNPSSFTLRVTPQRIDIRGLSDEGTRFGAYELLEQLGVRWYAPGDWGRVVPETATARLPVQETSQAPDMAKRALSGWLPHNTPWYGRQRFGGLARSTGGHGIPPFGPQRALFDEHPEYYALIDGERRRSQLCVSHPDVLALAIEHLRRQLENNPDLKYVGMGPNDGHGYCECDNCQALDQGVHNPLRDDISKTDRYVWFFNQMLEALEDEHPDVHIVTYVYAAHAMPPKIQPNPRIVATFAPINLDRPRSMDNPMSPDRHVFRWLLDEWGKFNLNEMYYRGYYNLLSCAQLPFSQIDRVRNEIPVLHERGIRVMRVEAIRQSWASNPISLYVAGRMMWDTDTDVDALLEEFYEKFYGPAAGPMREYHEMLEAAFRDTPYFTGSSYPYLRIFLGQPRRDRMRNLLDEAVTLAADHDASIYAERVGAIRQGYRRMDLFLDMIEARNAFDFVTAHEKMQAFYALTDELVDHVLEEEETDQRHRARLVNYMERSEWRGSYFNRFFGITMKSGYERAVEQGEIVAGLPDEWLFLIDPSRVGEMAGYQRPGELGGNWQPLKTTSQSWSDQGLHYYKGVAWYRASVTIPEAFEGRPIYLWFGGVDELASVWINGEFVGTSEAPEAGLPGAPGAFRPFDLPASDAVRFGEENWVVVRIENEVISDVGTGGILSPVMFWSPHDPAWTPDE